MPPDNTGGEHNVMSNRPPMILVKCPRCELNYIHEGEELCKVCFREVHGAEPQDEPEICSECNTERALPGKDLCIFCLKEKKKNRSYHKAMDEEPVDLDMNDVSGMEEIITDLDEDDPDYHELGDTLSLEEMGEQEDQESDDEDEFTDG
jgi:hypothetical protein